MNYHDFLYSAQGFFMIYKHIIWDWNGTIINDLWLSVEVFNQMRKKQTSLPDIDIEIYRKNFRFPVSDFYTQFGFDLSGENYHKTSIDYIKIYNARRFECALQEGVTDALRAYQEAGASQSVLSAYEKNFLRQAIEHYNLEKYFMGIDGLCDVDAASKIELGKAHIKKLGLNPREVLMIGDTIHDKHVADAMNTDCVLLCRGHNDRQRLSRTGAPIFDSHAQIARYVLNAKA